jgi:hypothetical protein
MRPAPLALLGSLVFLSALPARAEAPRHALQLVYVRGNGAAACPDEAVLRKDLAAVMHYDPVRAGAPQRLTAVIERREAELTAIAILRDEKGHVLWETDLIATTSPCRVLVGALALAIDAWLGVPQGPSELPKTPPEPPAPQPAAPAPAPAPPPEPPKAAQPPAPAPALPPPVTAPRSVSGYAGAGALGVFGATRTPSLGAELFGGARLHDPALFFEVGGRVTSTLLATELRSRNGAPFRARSTFLGATLAVCGQLGRFAFACGLAGAGTMTFRVLEEAETTSARYSFGIVGARLGLQHAVAEHVQLRVFAELSGLPTSATLRDQETQVVTKPPVMGAAGVGLVWSP